MDYHYLQVLGIGLIVAMFLLVMIFELITSIIRWTRVVALLPEVHRKNILKAIFLPLGR